MARRKSVVRGGFGKKSAPAPKPKSRAKFVTKKTVPVTGIVKSEDNK